MPSIAIDSENVHMKCVKVARCLWILISRRFFTSLSVSMHQICQKAIATVTNKSKSRWDDFCDDTRLFNRSASEDAKRFNVFFFDNRSTHFPIHAAWLIDFLHFAMLCFNNSVLIIFLQAQTLMNSWDIPRIFRNTFDIQTIKRVERDEWRSFFLWLLTWSWMNWIRL